MRYLIVKTPSLMGAEDTHELRASKKTAGAGRRSWTKTKSLVDDFEMNNASSMYRGKTKKGVGEEGSTAAAAAGVNARGGSTSSACHILTKEEVQKTAKMMAEVR